MTKVKVVAPVKVLPAKVAKVPRMETPQQWAELHRRALLSNGEDDSEWLAHFRKTLPCGECRKHWDEMMVRTEPDFAGYFAWTVDRHNEVNRKLGKPEMTLDEARIRWARGGVTLVGSAGKVAQLPSQ